MRSEPAELPPRDFTGAQYIDSEGCVFLRDGFGWTARLDDQGAVLCGFPPSFAARQGGSAGLHAPNPSVQTLERELTVSVIAAEGLADPAKGTATDASITARPIKAPDLANGTDRKDVLGDEIVRAVKAQPVLAYRMALPTSPGGRLCDLLGMSRAARPLPGFADDPTGGYCAGGMVRAARSPAGPDDTLRGAPRAIPVAPMRIGNPVAAQPGKAAGKNSVAAAAAPVKPVRPVGGGQRRDTVASQPATKPPVATSRPEVPASARYVQIGLFNRDGVIAAIAALRAMGYPVARQVQADKDGRRIILAGPFTSRERLIAALDRLRQAGYPEVAAR
ncbi:hypothetical protein FQV27_05085 [Paracoccus aurantiacus]|uniref:SPOR domain-containing protein n=1 Tax=Paracoccus aurantiacus TaxID=2599412 RepID=A0A5C6S8P4_9RHOB|nr:SPOR domain-containing protein [Paracoccus aurantiacus]TXB71219.1 hypothetical protein FQV27_05085 [Paracoccus aurantiacus]